MFEVAGEDRERVAACDRADRQVREPGRVSAAAGSIG
jgi:hypothetical protein